MSIEHQFNLIAAEYDGNRRKFILCFDDFYKNTTAFIASNVCAPKRIVDLDVGTGLLTYDWYQYFPDAEYVLAEKLRFQSLRLCLLLPKNFHCRRDEVGF